MAIPNVQIVPLNSKIPEIGDGVKIKLTKKEMEPLLRILSGTRGEVSRVEINSDGVLRYSVLITVKDEEGKFPLVQLRTLFFPGWVGRGDSVHRSIRDNSTPLFPVLRPLEGETEDHSPKKLIMKRPLLDNPDEFGVVGGL